jgi:hypothetical protein
MTQQTPPPSGFPGPTEPFTPVTPEPFYTPPAPPARKSGGTSGMTLALAAAVLIAGCGISFAAGRATAPAAAASVGGPDQGQLGQGGPGGQNPPAGGVNGGTGQGPLSSGAPNASFDLNGNGNGDGGQGGPGDGGGFGRGGFGAPTISGTVQATDGKTLTLKLANGQTVTINLDAKTTYSQRAAGSASDVAAGKTVIVSINGRFDVDGQEGGSTASNITIVP